MKKFLLLGALLLVSSTMAWAQNYTATATAVTDDPEWYDYLWCDDYYAPNPSPEVEVYDDYLIVKSWCGADGYDLKVEFNADEQVIALTSIVDGVAGERKDAGYVTIPTPDSSASFYIARNFAYAGADSEGGYVVMSCYLGTNTSKFYLYEIEFDAPTEGVSRVMVSDGLTQYYTLDGMVIDRPTTPGIYIMRKGNKTSKILVR